MNRMKDTEKLTIESLRKYIPVVKEGYAAKEQLDNAQEKTIQERRALHIAMRDGEQAKEQLFLMAMPLIITMATKEYNRRQAWSSKVTFDDLMSDGFSGFLRGILAYNVDGKHSSPTNYIGQWIFTEMSRNADQMDHDFSIPGEAIERHRKIRAIRARLSTELGREPTDEEIVIAAEDTSHAGGALLGRSRENKLKEQERPRPRRRILTVKHVEEERFLRSRTGNIRSTQQPSPEQEDQVITDSENMTIVNDDNDPTKSAILADQGSIDERSAQYALSQLLENAFIVMEIGKTQSDIIRRRFGLIPYENPQTIKDIILHTGVPKHKVSRIMIGFSAEMTRVNSPFHELISTMSYDELDSMGIGWVHATLGEFLPPATRNTNRDLKNPNYNPRKIERDPPRLQSHAVETAKGVLANFYCASEDFVYAIAYETAEMVPMTRTCPRCKKQSSYEP